ncbi:hypothetical protein KMZ32_15740 [Phycicoccus sp. MAQZ13P-2]|uniref:hypothetical protein n=1 Tax=Phycicoccus mangrovi TaxID=2840470 RepID=UPI001C001482|nr:hypothetical protein [Phycicoccus mangrovi]MBT9254058.1 hypothetical protein [Phycicoccus mangrovi]MBT9275529.1 hypothetical protein [Phycicoccus mangrovi]
MRTITPGIARAVTPSDWTPEQLARREAPPRQLHLPRIPRPVAPHLPHLGVARHRTP